MIPIRRGEKMKNIGNALLLVIVIGLVYGVQADSFSNDVIEVHTSPYYYAYNSTSAEIVVRHPDTGNPYTSGEDDISIYIMYPDGTMYVNGSHPYEFRNGIYKKNIDINDQIGTYIIWAILNISGTEYLGANMFEVRWSPYTNISGAEYKLGNVVSLVNWIGRNNSQEIISQISDIQESVSESGQETEKAGFFDRLQQTAFSSFISWIFMITLMLLVFVVGTWIYGRRKASKLAMKVANVPGTIVSALTGGGK
jgi:hypothetical protein